MSLIEQAAKRLGELKRAGVAGQDAPVAAEPDKGATAVPTPEALMRALDQRTEPASGAAQATPLLTPAQRQAAPKAEVPLRAAPAPEAAPQAVRPSVAPRPSPQSRSLVIDLARLKARGYVTPDAPATALADEFRVVKRPIIQNAQGREGAQIRHGNLVMITSAMPGEGKTFTAVNLAMSIAMEYNSTVLLVDGDVAHPGFPSLLGSPEGPGLLDLLTNDKIDVSDALLRTNIDRLSILPAGAPQRRATELLASESMARLLHDLATRYPDRIIVFDAPPLLPATEARVLATQMGQIVMVVAAESTSQNTLNRAMETIESCEVVLMMLNKADRTEVGRYAYYPADAVR